MTGPIVALPLDRKNRVVGVLAVARAEGAREFSDADLNLLVDVRRSSRRRGRERAALSSGARRERRSSRRRSGCAPSELTAINFELGRALADLRETQAQLVLSERMAGLGLLRRRRRARDQLAVGRDPRLDRQPRSRRRAGRRRTAPSSRSTRAQPRVIDAFIEETAPMLAERPLATGLAARKAARELAAALDARRARRARRDHRERARRPRRDARPTRRDSSRRSARTGSSRRRSSRHSPITCTCTARRRPCATRSRRSSASSVR